MSTVPSKADAKLLDVPCDEIASKLATRLTWLNNAYGRCEKYFKNVDGRDEVMPAIYSGGRNNNGYLILLPDEGLGNFMFIDVDPSQTLLGDIGQLSFEVDISLIFWFNYQEVYTADHVNRTIENVKYDILTEIKKGGFDGVRMEVYEVHESAKEIYSTFSTRLSDSYAHKDSLRQALMRPYGGLRVDCNLRYTQLC